MDKELRILILEDVPADAELEEHELRKSGLIFTLKVVDTREAFLKELDEFLPDLILSDYDLPTFDGLAALRIAKEKCPDVPFILVTGKLGEEFAIEKLKEGATDYVLKGNLKRLAPSVKRALEETKLITERKRVEEALRKEHDFSQNILNTAQAIILVVDCNGNIVNFNPYMEEKSGYRLDEVKGKDWFSTFLPKENRYRTRTLFKKAISDIKTKGNIDSIITKNGRKLYIEWHDTTMKGEDGKIIGLLSIGQDVTERMRAEEALRESEEKYRLLFEAEPDAILVFDGLSRTIIDVNTVAQKLYGHSREEFLNMQLKDVAAQPEESEKTFRIALTGKLLKVPLKYHRKKDGTVFPVDISAGTFSLRGQLVAIGAIRDVTEKKQAEETLRDSMERYRLLFNGITDAVYVHEVSVEKPGKFLAVNDSACSMLGYTMDEFMQMEVDDIDIPEQSEKIPSIQKKLFRDGYVLFETCHIAKDGRRIPVEINLQLIELQGKSMVLSVARDITERKIRKEHLDSITMELSISMFEVFEALKKISSGDPDVSLSEESEIELMSQLRKEVNTTAKNVNETVEQSHEFAMALTELFHVFHRVTKGDLNARVSGESNIDLLNTLRNTSNEMIESMDREIFQRRFAEKTLHDSEEYQKTIMAAIQAGVMIIDVEKHTIADINMAAENLIGVKREAIIGQECHKYICPAEKGKCPITDLNQIVDRSERVLINAQHEQILILKTVVPLTIKGRKYLIESFIDISERKRMEEELKRLSVTDNMTQAYNRTKYEEVIKREIERTKRSSSPLSIVMFDIDHFKEVNDAYGHAVGDSVLKTLSQIAKRNIRDIDYLIRWGGEEFLLIGLDTDLKGAGVIAEKIRHAIESHGFDKVSRVTVSFGVTQFKQDDTEDSFVKRADNALYQAKEKGRNRVEVAV